MEKAFENICEFCGTEKELVPAGKRKDGSTFNSFMGCPNFKSHPKDTKRSTSNKSHVDPQQLIMDEIREINSRLDKLADYLKSKLS